jgi:hypothetical protein
MSKPWQWAFGTMLLLTALATGGEAAEQFHKLSGGQIHSTFTGMEMTDETHWGDVFGPNGTLTTYAMGRKSTGSWHVKKDELCVERSKDDGGCYQVWLSGKKVELRREGSTLPMEGVLRKPIVRH